MKKIFSITLLPMLLLVGSRVWADDKARQRFAECIGGGDVYAESAAQYGFDLEAHKNKSKQQMKLLSGGDEAPSLTQLERRRESGRKKYQRLQTAVKGKQEGPAWEEFKYFHTACDDARRYLVSEGVLE